MLSILNTLIVIFLLLLAPITHANNNGCKPLELHFIDADKQGIDLSSAEEGDEIEISGPVEGTALIMCNSTNTDIEDTTLVSFMIATEDGFCYADKTCGNLKAMGAYFSTGPHIGMYSSLGSYQSPERSRDYSLGVRVLIGFNDFNRYCSKQSEPICVKY